MSKAADLAFRQTIALYPGQPEIVSQYVQLLLDLHRTEDAIAVVKTAMHTTPNLPYFKEVLSQLEKL